MKVFMRLFLTGIILAFAFSGNSLDNRGVNILEYFQARNVTGIYIEDISNASGDNLINLGLIKKEIENAFMARVSQKFEIARLRDKSDVALRMEITEYLWTNEDPVDNLIGIGGVAMDVAKQENYARMIAGITIMDTATGDVLWEDTIKATITDDTMTEQASYGRINERIVKVLMRNIFSRNKNR